MPPVMVLPNWLTTLPSSMLIVPPVLLMLWPAEMPILAVEAPPTLMTPLLVVPPPPTRLRPKASMLIWPALFSVRIDCPVLIVTTPAAPILAVSLLPGVVAGLPLPAPQVNQSEGVAQLPAVTFQVQVAARACCAGKARRMARRAGLTVESG